MANSANNKLIIIAEKESFVVRVLIKKTRDVGYDCNFVPCTIDAINSELNDEGRPLITLFIDDGAIPPDDVLHFLKEKMDEKGLSMILVADKKDMKQVEGSVPKDLIYAKYSRPVNNEQFVYSVVEYFIKNDAGELKKSILVVDDDPQFLSLVREWLRGTYKVSMANSGLQAIKWLGKNKVDLILLDYEMPITSGPQVLEMLRADDETKSIHVMFLTGKGDKESVMKVLALKPEGYFLKTIRKEELLEKLQEFFILR